MFGKKICRRCGSSIKGKYDFCPYCGNQLEKKKENFGMLGKDDFFNESPEEPRLPAGFNLLFNSLMKNFEKQFREAERKTEKPEEKKGHISISISAFGNKAPLIKVSSPVRQDVEKKRIKRKSFDDLPPEKLKKFSQLPREEPKTSIRRLSNKVLYEVALPGVKSAKDISILNLEKGIELKAVSDKKAYLKSIPINLPIIKYKLSKGKLVLEMDAHEE